MKSEATLSSPPHEPARPAEVAEEERLLEVVTRSIATFEQRTRGAADYEGEIVRLRDALAEEKLADDQASLLEQMDRLSALSVARQKHVEGTIDRNSPYFGHMRLEGDDGARRDILIGKHTYIRDGIRIVDWRNAPISRVFYGCQEGDPFDLVIAGREVSGEVAVRRTVTVMQERLVRVGSPRGTYLRTPEGWRTMAAGSVVLAGGAGMSARPDTSKPLLGLADGGAIRADKHLPEIAALLDGAQFELITRPGSGIVAIQGSAGSGKTTVGLHRLAYLNFRDPQRFRPHTMLVMVFSEALARYISQVLPALGVSGVPVKTLESWAAKVRKQHFPGLPRQYAEATPASVVRFKSHRALLFMLDEATATAPRMGPVALFDELFTDRGWIARGVATHAPGQFSDSELDEVHRWCSEQQGRRFEGSFESSDEGEDTGDGQRHEVATFDPEDDIILLRLHQLLRGPLLHRAGQPMRYHHLMIDEVQDFSPLELRVLIDTVHEQSVTLAGDTAQQIAEGREFSDWSAVLDAIGQGHTRVSPLRVSYRSTQQIMEAARAVLGPLAPDEPLQATRSGAPVELFRCGGLGEATVFLADALRDLVEREPQAGVAILTRFPHQADEAFEALSKTDIEDIRRVKIQDFAFGPGIEITDIGQTKGLEFDYVVILNCDEESFPDTDAARHLLHVAMTRAAHQLWLFCWRRPSPLLPPSIISRLAG